MHINIDTLKTAEQSKPERKTYEVEEKKEDEESGETETNRCALRQPVELVPRDSGMDS